MIYEFDINMFVHISADIVEHMVTSMVEEQTGKKVKKLKIKYNDDKFIGYDIEFVSEKSNTKKNRKPHKIDKSFKPWIIE